MSLSLVQQLEKHVGQYREDGVLLDSNVLLLLLAYRFESGLVGAKKLEKYSVEDAQLLLSFVEQFKRILTTSSILTEVSNLAGLMLYGQKRMAFFSQYRLVFDPPDSHSVQHCSLHGAALPLQSLVKLGYTDASIISVAQAPHFLLTDDLDLFLDAQQRAIPSINFTHMLEVAYAL